MQVTILGDVHLGKKFETGVPLHRRGDREAMQWAEFDTALMSAPPGLHIQMGDIFDKMIVPYTVIYRAAMAYRAAARANPNTRYVLLRGNHDSSRDADRVSAFQIFTELVTPYGIEVAADHPIDVSLDGVAGYHVLVPWHPFKTALEMVDEILGDYGDTDGPAYVYGHWDVVMGAEHQLPAARLRELGFAAAYTGHDHNKRDVELEGLPVHVTGSMQPYSHGEDAEGRIYVTRTLAEVLADPDVYKDKALRITLGPDEVLDQSIDCLQLTLQRERAEATDLGEVDFEAFDLATLFDQARQEVGLDDAFGSLVLTKLEEARAAQS